MYILKKERVRSVTVLITYLIIMVLFFSCELPWSSKNTEDDSVSLATTPPLGWNSFDSYGVYLHEEAALANLESFAVKLAPYGYEYFVIDAGWFGEFQLKEGTLFPVEKHAKKLNFNEFGLLQPSNTYFPRGLKPIIDRCHELGLKFGLHLMRGIPRAAYYQNTKIKGTEYHARDIADTTSICLWNQQNFGVDMSKPGAQDFYNSLMNQMAEWGVDFIKYDDLVPFPEEIKGIANAIKQTGRPMILSLSPGDKLDSGNIEIFKRANMLRVTPDIWDDQEGIDQSFSAWRKWKGQESPGFWIDMDMIPFGQLQLMSPRPEGIEESVSKEEYRKKMALGEVEKLELLAGKGWTRWSKFTRDQMYTFITLRALSASPLMVGGDLPTLDSFSLKLLTHPEVIKCNQNGVMGNLVFEGMGIEIWTTREKESNSGWAGIFNRSDTTQNIEISLEKIGINPKSRVDLIDIWSNISIEDNVVINPHGVIFIRFKEK